MKMKKEKGSVCGPGLRCRLRSCVCVALLCVIGLCGLCSVPGNAGTRLRAPHAASYLPFMCVCVCVCVLCVCSLAPQLMGLGNCQIGQLSSFFFASSFVDLPFTCPNASMNAVAPPAQPQSWSSLCCNELSSLLFLRCTVLQLRECSLLLIS